MLSKGLSFTLKTSKAFRKRITRSIKTKHHIDTESVINLIALSTTEDPNNYSLRYCQSMLDNIDTTEVDDETLAELVNVVSSLIVVDGIKRALEGEPNRLIRPGITERTPNDFNHTWANVFGKK